MDSDHYRKLERMYLAANINSCMFDTTTIKISGGESRIGLDVEEKYFHALGAIHGSIYFKLLDDAAFFAVNSLVQDVFVLTTSFNINLVRPVSAGRLYAVGTVKFKSRNLFIAESSLFDHENKEVAFGTGNFARSKVRLSPDIGYQ